MRDDSSRSNRWTHVDGEIAISEELILARIKKAPQNCQRYLARLIWWDCVGLCGFPIPTVEKIGKHFSRAIDKNFPSRLVLRNAITRIFLFSKEEAMHRLKEFKDIYGIEDGRELRWRSNYAN